MWLLNGDKNTSYFHKVVQRRRAANRILKLHDDQGRVIQNYEDIELFATRHFENLYSMEGDVELSSIDEWLEGVGIPTLSDCHITGLNQPVKNTEIFDAVNQLEAFNSPGPDGLPPGFYQHFWSVLGNDICNLVQSFFHRGYLLKKLNEPFITLIPKVQNPDVLSQFRPISLCNAVYKIISKVIVNRLQPIMQDISLSECFC